MNDIRLDFEWVDPGGARGPELRATWARLTIRTDAGVVTQVYDTHTQAVRDAIYLPLYPLAEWIASHWWWLLHEVETPGTPRHATYPGRHSLATAREGYALPDLWIVPEGPQIRLRWQRADLPDCHVKFRSEGEALVGAERLADVLREWLTAVLGRLDACGVTDTWLHEEWAAIQHADAEERETCIALASLGLDPYDTDEADVARITAVRESLPPPD